jgi:hypothetical protein
MSGIKRGCGRGRNEPQTYNLLFLASGCLKYGLECPTGFDCPLFDTLVLPPPVWMAHQVAYQAAG